VCKIFIDGRDTGLNTPQRDLDVRAGSHRITLVTVDGSYKETFSVAVKAGEGQLVKKNYMDKLSGD
jgi:hypothetical protein